MLQACKALPYDEPTVGKSPDPTVRVQAYTLRMGSKVPDGPWSKKPSRSISLRAPAHITAVTMRLTSSETLLRVRIPNRQHCADEGLLILARQHCYRLHVRRLLTKQHDRASL